MRKMLKVNMEAGAGIEPANNDFADRRLTTWLPRRWCCAQILGKRTAGVNLVFGKDALFLSEGLSGNSLFLWRNGQRRRECLFFKASWLCGGMPPVPVVRSIWSNFVPKWRESGYKTHQEFFCKFTAARKIRGEVVPLRSEWGGTTR